MKQETLDAVAAILNHPFKGQRKTDVQLAQAAIQGHLGLKKGGPLQAVYPARHGSLTDGLREQNIPVRRTGIGLIAGLFYQLLVQQRRWRLLRSLQVDQGNTPWCVDATRCHWQLSLPVYGTLTYPLGALYELCKQIDPWPGEDGTSAEFMLTVCQNKELVESSWVWSGPQDNEAALRWLTEVGGLWFGSMWPEDAFRTRQFKLPDGTWTTDGVVEVAADAQWLYGHEVFLIGRQRNYKRMGPHIEGVQSWGQDNYGVRGRFWIPERDFFDRWMDPARGWGDLYGVVERT